MPTRIAINGFGRIGRPTFKAALDLTDLEIAAINDLMNVETLVYLLKYDTVYGHYDREVEIKDGNLIIDGKEFKVLAEKDPENLPWKDMSVDVVLECTGFFTEREAAEKHIRAGAKKVIISAPAKGNIKTFVQGVNEEEFNPKIDHVISNASCTTNCLAPIAKVLDKNFGVKEGLMTTIHSYTSTQSLVDGPNPKDVRRGRAAAENLVLTTTGAAKATCQVIPNLTDKFSGMAVRVPTPTVSLVDLSAVLSREVSVKEVNEVFIKAAEVDLKGILGVTKEPLVSTDFRGDNRLAIVDLPSTMVIKNLVKIFAWYDNEWGYAYGLAAIADYIGKKLKK
jgi:glyceraldehyde 3-phosphate dehydrogenase